VLISRCIGFRRQQRANPGPPERSMFASRGYQLVVLGEIIALVVGGLVLGTTHQIAYQIVWYAFVAGVHFVIFGKLFVARFYYIGGAMIVFALAGLVIGLAGGGIALVQAVTGFGSGLTLFIAPAITIVQYRAQQARLAV
jgi:hypothetical protein